MPLESIIQQKTFLKKIVTNWAEEEKDSKENISQVIIQTVFESLLEAERNSFLKNENNQDEKNKGNGYYTRLAKLLSGVFELRVPRDRLGLFKPLTLEIIKKDQENLNNLAFKLYAKGLSTRDINDILEEIYSAKTSPQYVSNITNSYIKVREKWQKRKLDNEYYGIYIDALQINIRRDTVENEAIYVVLGLKKDFTREILGIYSIPQESASGWQEVLEDLKSRGVKNVLLFVADGLTGLENAIHTAFPKSYFQKCIVHLHRNVYRRVRTSDKAEIAEDLRVVFNLDKLDDTKEKALKRLDVFLNKWEKKYPRLKNIFNDNVKNYYFTYLYFPNKIWRMIYSTNWIERANKEIRKVTRNKNSFPNENSALTLIWLKLTDLESKTYSYPVTRFNSSRDKLEKMIKNI